MISPGGQMSSYGSSAVFSSFPKRKNQVSIGLKSGSSKRKLTGMLGQRIEMISPNVPWALPGQWSEQHKALEPMLQHAPSPQVSLWQVISPGLQSPEQNGAVPLQ